MIGLALAECSRAVRRRPNAALVVESKRSGSSSSGGAVAPGMSSAASWSDGVSRLQEELQSDISVGIHCGFG